MSLVTSTRTSVVASAAFVMEPTWPRPILTQNKKGWRHLAASPSTSDIFQGETSRKNAAFWVVALV
jgi:hypothetical protein